MGEIHSRVTFGCIRNWSPGLCCQREMLPDSQVGGSTLLGVPAAWLL